MSSVTEVKLKIKPPSAEKTSSNKSIGQVANYGVKQETRLPSRTNLRLSRTIVKSSTIEETSHSAGSGDTTQKYSKPAGVCTSVKKNVQHSDRNTGSEIHVNNNGNSSSSSSSGNINVKEVSKQSKVKSTSETSNDKSKGNYIEDSKLVQGENAVKVLVFKPSDKHNSTSKENTSNNVGKILQPSTVNNGSTCSLFEENKVKSLALNVDKVKPNNSYSSKLNVNNTSDIKVIVGNDLTNHSVGGGDVTQSTALVTESHGKSIPKPTKTPVNVQCSATESNDRIKQLDPNSKNMFSQLMKDELLKKRNDMLEGPTKDTMDQEKHVDLGEEPPDKNDELDDTVCDKIVPPPSSMVDELQKYLLKRFGPVQVVNLNEDAVNTKFVNKDSNDTTSDNVDRPNPPVINNTTAHSVPVKSPTSPDAILPHPIFFKTSIKSDPGSKLHDQLLKELGSVLKKKTNKSADNTQNGHDKNEAENSEKQGERILPKRRVSAKGNKILGNKLLLANLENQLQRTLNRNKIFQRQKLKVVDLETIEVADNETTSHMEASKSPISATPKNEAKLIHDFKNFNNTDANVISAMQELDQTINAHSDGSSETPSSMGDNTEKLDLFEKRKNDINDNNDEGKELYVVAFKNPSGITEGVVCSVERRESTRDSSGRPRKYLTCINIVGEKSTDIIDEGCPFTQDIADGGLPTASGAGLFFGEEDKPAHFNVDVGRRKGDLRVSVSGPNSIAKCSVDPQSDGSYTVTFIPVETGLFDIRVTWNDTDIAGSPYHPKVVDARKVRIIGGWQHFFDSNERVNLVVGENKQLPFDVSEAGPGVLRAEVKGPSRQVDVDIDNHTIGRSVVEFVPREEGTHYIHLFWSDIPLVNSPFLGFAVQHTPDASKLILTGRGLKEAVVREEAEFVIDGSQAGRGNPNVVLTGVRAEVNVKVSPIGNGKFRCTYIPILPGAYLLHITWNGRQLRGSPYKVNVIGAFYPNRVVVSGVGGAILGREMMVGIDTRKAGPGELTAYCMGPHQVAYCELEDNHDGTFRLAVKAQESGRHVLQIKYGGEHVQGSPFVYKVTAQPDASKVRVHGPGVEHGILATYISRFIVETRGAGAGQLTVRIRGPKGAFQVEMYRDSQRDRTILCKFDPTECGLYIISVKWSGVDVPGSPFHVHILDTQEELEQVLNEVSYSIGTSHSQGPSAHSGSHMSHTTPRMVYGQWRDQI